MNLNQLYYLQAIAQARGLTRAADALYVTQSNLSHSMAALEEELGIPLLYKNGRDTLLTPYGQEFLAYAERAIQQIEEGKRVAQSRCSPTRNLVLSMFRQQDLQPDVAFEVATDHMLASFVSQGLGVGIMPRMFGLRLYSVRPLYIADTETHRMLYMFRPKDRRVLPAVQRFWDFVLEVCAQYQSDE